MEREYIVEYIAEVQVRTSVQATNPDEALRIARELVKRGVKTLNRSSDADTVYVMIGGDGEAWGIQY
jgi:diacylglycerol kinase family enzyme